MNIKINFKLICNFFICKRKEDTFYLCLGRKSLDAALNRGTLIPYINTIIINSFWIIYIIQMTDLLTFQVLLPRVLGMYLISGTAFIIYLTKIPERFFPGKVDYLGHSHQWWHMFILLALYYWHNSGMLYVQYRMNHVCMQNMHIL